MIHRILYGLLISMSIFSSIVAMEKVVLKPTTKPAPALPATVDALRRPFYGAIQSQDLLKVKNYLRQVPALAHEKYFGQSVLLTAVNLVSSPEIIAALLDAGADINSRDSLGNSPLVAAIEKEAMRRTYGTSSFYDRAKLLIERGANLNTQDNIGRTPLIIASSEGLVDIVKLLLSQGITSSSTIREQESTRSYLGKLPHDIFQMVRQYGVDPNIKDKDGKTALDHARMRLQHADPIQKPAYEEIIKLLEPITKK